MEWTDKEEMCALLDNHMYADATEFYLTHENWNQWSDLQALELYASGIDISKAYECVLFEDKLKKLQVDYRRTYGNLSFRTILRLGLLLEEFDRLNKLRKHKPSR